MEPPGNIKCSRIHVTIRMLAVINATPTQTTSPAASGSPAAPSSDDDSTTWLWIIIGLLSRPLISGADGPIRSTFTISNDFPKSHTPGTPSPIPLRRVRLSAPASR